MAKRQPHDRMWKAYETLKEMLIDRHYELNDEMKQVTEESIELFVTNSQPVVTVMSLRTKQPLCVFWDTGNHKMGVKNLRDYLEYMKENNIQDAIVIAEQGITPSGFKELIKSGKHIHVFEIASLYRNITHHFSVSQHRALSEEEVKTICQQRKLKITDFPPYLPEDPIVRYYGYKEGQVIEIRKRLGGAVMEQVRWRVVKSYHNQSY